MGNIGSTSINIKSMDKCLAIADDIAKNRSAVIAKKCTGESDQIFQYDPETMEIKYGDKCFESEGNKIQLWPCNDGANQKWNFCPDQRLTTLYDDKKCLEIKDEHSRFVPNALSTHDENVSLADCTGNENQRFRRIVIDQKPNTIPRIMRNNLVIPNGTVPVPQLSVLPANSVLFMNARGKNVMINAEIVLDHNSRELKCLGTIDKFIIGPFTTLKVIYIDRLQSRQQLVFKNGSAEHDLIYDLHTSFDENYLGLIDRIVGFDIGGDGLCGIIASHIIDDSTPSGTILISNYSGPMNSSNYDKNNFLLPNNSFTINPTQIKDYILGPLTIAVLGNTYLYNSSDKPMMYSGLKGVSARERMIHTYIAAPLNSGYATFTLNCDLSGTNTTAIIGEYSISGPEIGAAVPRNSNWQGQYFYSNAPNRNPVKIIGNDKISGVIVGPYTRVTLYHDTQYQGTTKIFKNNSPHEVKYDLCQEKFNDVTSSIKIEYSAAYVGFGLISLSPETYKPMTYKEACETPAMFLEEPEMHLEKPMMQTERPAMPALKREIMYYINDILYDISAGDMGPGMQAVPRKMYSPIEKQWGSSDFSMNCRDHGITSIEPSKDNNKFYNKYTCSDGLKYHNPTTIQSSPVPMSSLSNININCNGKAITGVKTITKGNSIVYEYMCGDRDLDDIRTYESKSTMGYPSDMSSIMGQKIKCPSGELTSYKLHSEKMKDTFTEPIFQYKFIYQCGEPSKKPGFHYSSTDKIIEGFDQMNKTSETVNLSFMNDGTEIHISYPSDCSIESRFPSDRIQFDADGVAIDLRQESGKIDKIICNGHPITVKNKNYTGMKSKPINKIYSKTETPVWFYLVIILTSAVIIYLVYKHYQK